MTLVRRLAAALAVTALLATGAAAGPASAADRTTITLIQHDPKLEVLDNTGEGAAGKLYLFYGRLTKGGKPFGVVEGTKVTLEHEGWQQLVLAR